MTVQQYMAQQVNWGGEWVTIGFLFTTFGDKFAGSWIAGYLSAGNEVRP